MDDPLEHDALLAIAVANSALKNRNTTELVGYEFWALHARQADLRELLSAYLDARHALERAAESLLRRASRTP